MLRPYSGRRESELRMLRPYSGRRDSKLRMLRPYSGRRESELRVFGVIRMRQARSGAGVTGGGLHVRFGAGGGPPSRSVLLQLAYFRATAVRVRFRAGTVTNGRGLAPSSRRIGQNRPRPGE